MHPKASMRTLIVLGLLGFAACADNTGAAGGAENRPPAPAMAQQFTGLSHLPAPVPQGALAASMRRHFPRHLAGVRARTAVLVDADIDARGRVADVRVIDRSAFENDNVHAVVRDRVRGTNQGVDREIRVTYDDAFGPAAQAALREVRFLPALKAGRPVPFTMRMTVEFADPTARK